VTHCPPPIGSPTGFVGAIRSLPPAALPFVVAVVVFSTVAVANVPVTGWLDGSPEQAQRLAARAPEPEAAAVLGEGGGKARARTRCDACGVVEAIRRIDPVGDLPAAYEFTVRLRDGSTRLSSNASQASWRAGDNIMLIGGANPAGR
jgi:hypothetical protein